jgi:hypothetical protein
MEGFLDYLFIVLPALRIDCFLKQVRPSLKDQVSDSRQSERVEFEMFIRKLDIRATAVLSGAEFIVQEGSQARKAWIGDKKQNTHYWKLFHELCDRGILVEDGGLRRFSENYAFTSTSAAGAVVSGRTTAGPIAWKLKGTKKTYKEWEAETLSDQ